MGGSDSKESACSVGDLVRFLGQEDLLEKEWQPTPGFLPGDFFLGEWTREPGGLQSKG